MNLSALSVRRGVTFAMAYLMLIGFGLFSLSRLQLDLYPDITFPTIVVITTYTGASPEDMETLVSRPIEDAVSAAKDVEEVRSTSRQGVSFVEVKFDWGKDMEAAETDVRRRLEMIESLLPSDADDSIVFAFDPSLQPILMMMVSGPYPLDELRRIAENDIEPRITRLPGVASAEVAGGLEREIHVVLDPVKVAAFQLDVNSIIGAVYAENTQLPGGSVQQGALDFNIHTKGKYGSVQEIGQVVVGARITPQGKVPIRLGEVAQIEDSFFESQEVLEVDGQQAVWMMVRKQSGANTVRAVEGVLNAIPDIKRATAADIEFKTIFDQAEFINQSLGNLSSTAMQGVALTFFVLLLFLRSMRSSLIVAASMPISVIATFALMDQAGMTLNILSMAGLALGIGMLVDNSIVVLENIFRLREEGRPPWDAAVDGARSVGLAVTASTLTTAVVFVPVLFVPGIAGVLFKDMAVTICFSLGMSLLVAISFIPLAASRLLGKVKVVTESQSAGSKRFHRLREAYGRSLDKVLRKRWVVVLAATAAVIVTGIMAVLLPTEFVHQDDQSTVFVSVEAPVGSNIEESSAIVREVVGIVEKVIKPEERKLVAINVGVGKGFGAMFSDGVHAGTIRVPLVRMSARSRSQQEIEEALRAELAKVPGIKYSVAMPFNMMGGEGDLQIEIRGHDLDVSRQTGLDLLDKLRAMPEMSEVSFSMQDQKPEVRVQFNRTKMGELGISTASASTAVSAYFLGKTAARYNEGGDEFDVVVRYAKGHRLDIDELRAMPLATPTGQTVPLGNVADISIGLAPVDITRLDQERVTRLTCYLRNTYTGPDGKVMRKDLGAAIKNVEAVLKPYPWPNGFSYNVAGSAEDFLTSFRYLGLALLVSIGLVYAVMAAQFESFRQPFIIMFTVPLAGVGVVLAFSLTRSTVDMSALIGIIMLVGIVVNNGIVMIDAANQLRDEGYGRIEAIAKAARIRLRPILMTSLTTILGMVPLALEIGEGAAGWSGMAKAVIGGLVSSTFLTLYVVPVMYTVFGRKDHQTTTSMPPALQRQSAA